MTLHNRLGYAECVDTILDNLFRKFGGVFTLKILRSRVKGKDFVPRNACTGLAAEQPNPLMGLI